MATVYETKATFFTSTLEKGRIRLDDSHFEFSYQNPRLGKNLRFSWEEIEQVEINVTLSKKIGSEFSIILNSQSRFRFSSKDAGKIVKLISDRIGKENIVRAPSLLNALTQGLRGSK